MRAPRPAGVLSDEDWHEIRDALVIAQDALGDGPRDVDESYLRNCILHLRLALRKAHKAAEVRA